MPALIAWDAIDAEQLVDKNGSAWMISSTLPEALWSGTQMSKRGRNGAGPTSTARTISAK